MKHLLLASLLIGLLCAPLPAREPQAANPAPLDVLAPFIGGEWKINGAWNDGNPLEAREVFDWGVGRKFIVCKTFVKKPAGGEYQRYETVFGVQDGKLMAWGFVFDGHSDLSEFKIDNKKLSSSKPMPGSDGKPSASILHQSIELVEANKFRWQVSIETDGKTRQVMDGVWIREQH